ncbi:MAG TPA: UDP-N-acetylmuramoyl-L-alanine--D-glutamate ligase [Firmicutes bacterium]|jgi:UDP-N-acetylmuramoylalanine--D-glutamate ligase|nr:UDP-N-acetylmuramoyl-L-alanine--D-glutamate ligase [Bacillota bacterium]
MGGKMVDYLNKETAVIGLAVSNTPLIRYLVNQGARVTVFDKKTSTDLQEYLGKLADLKLNYCLGEDYLTHLNGFEYIFVTPGMKKDIPEFQKARETGAIFSSEMELFLEKCPGRIIGITGSSGKTTTTTLIGLMVASEYPATFIGGNIGRSLMDQLPRMNAESRVILELSSFQLQSLKQSPHLAIITNITPNHLDMHASMEEYIDAKSNILRYQGPDDVAILNYDNEITHNLRNLVRGRLVYFSRKQRLEEGAYLEGDQLVISLEGKTELLTTRGNLKLLGDHNVENILTAALAGRLSNVSLSSLTKVAEEFNGVEHRLELVRDLRGVFYYNDSISTTPDRAIAGLLAMTKPTVLIAGGYDKRLPFDSLASVIVKKCKCLVVLGVTAPLIIKAIKAIQSDFPIISVTTFEQAVAAASRMVAPGEVVLLSPACASYDMFKNYRERGLLFKKLVNAMNP